MTLYPAAGRMFMTPQGAVRHLLAEEHAARKLADRVAQCGYWTDNTTRQETVTRLLNKADEFKREAAGLVKED